MQPNNLTKIQNTQFKVLYLTTLVLLLPIFAGIVFLYTEDTQEPVITIEKEQIVHIPVNLNAVTTTAHSAFVVALTDGTVLYQKNHNQQLPLASLTKLVTIKIADDLSQGDTITIKKSTDFPEYGDVQLLEGDSWNKDELVDYTLLTSSNDGAHSLLDNSKNSFSFIKNMNTFTASIGLANTHFYNETGLDNDNTRIVGSKGTAQEMSQILSYLVEHNLPLYEKTKYESIIVATPEGSKIATNTNDVTNKITGLLVSKTGYTDSAGGNLAIVADMGLNEPTAFVVLKSSREARFDDILKLQNEYFDQVREGMK